MLFVLVFFYFTPPLTTLHTVQVILYHCHHTPFVPCSFAGFWQIELINSKHQRKVFKIRQPKNEFYINKIDYKE